MSSSEVKVSYENESCIIKFQEYKKLQELRYFLWNTFNLGKFRLYYKEREKEIYIDTEQDYINIINKGDVKWLFIMEDNQNQENQREKNNFDFFMSQLFSNNICCENDQYGCVICQEKKQVKTEEFNQLVKECLYELLKKEDFQAFCKKQFNTNVENVNLFLEKFSKLSKPIKQILTIQPSQQQFQNNFYNQLSSAIRPSQSQVYKQIPMNKSTNMARQSEIQQKSQFIHQGSSNIQVSNIIIPELGVKYDVKKNDYKFDFDVTAKIEVVIQNIGSKIWPPNVFLKQVGHYPANFQYVPSLNPGEKRTVNLLFQTPLNSGSYTFTWVLFYKDDDNQEKRIGSRCITEFKVKDLNPQQKINKCVDLISNKIFLNNSRKLIRTEVENIVQKYPDMGLQQIINMVQEKLEK